MLGHPAADLCDFQQLRLADGIGALRRLLLRQLRVTVGQVDDGIRHHDLSAIEEGLLQVAGHRVIQLGQGHLRLFLDAADAHLQQPAPVHCGLAVAPDGLAVDEDDSIGAQGLHILGGHQPPAVQDALVLPVVLDLLQIDLLALLAEIERVEGAGADGIHFLLNDSGGAVRVQNTRPGLEAHAADQQLVVLDVDLLLLAGPGITRGLLEDPGLALCLLESLGDVFGVVDVHIHPGIQILLPQRLNALHISFCHVMSLLNQFFGFTGFQFPLC